MYQPPIIDLQAITLDPAPRPRRIRRAIAIAAAAFLLPLGLYFAIAPHYRAHRQAAVQAAARQHATSRRAILPAKPKATGRPVYPYSVIPGGAYNIAELARAMDSDPVVARHYGEFDRAKLTTTRSVSVRPVYVSYRVGDTIYWSRKPVRLKMGELLLTDGTNFARARCGNRIALSVQSPVAHSEPIPGVLDIPVFVAGEAGIPEEEIAGIAPVVPSPSVPPGAAPYVGGPNGPAGSKVPGWLVPVAASGVVAGVVAVASNGSHPPSNTITPPPSLTTFSGPPPSGPPRSGPPPSGPPPSGPPPSGPPPSGPPPSGPPPSGPPPSGPPPSGPPPSGPPPSGPPPSGPPPSGPPPSGPPPGDPPPGGPPLEVVPEPSFWVPCLIGFGAIVAVKSYRRRRAVQD